MKIFKLIVFYSLLVSSCTNPKAEENQQILIKKESSSSDDIGIEERNILDTVIYQNKGFPPRELLVENLSAPIIIEGRIIRADSISEWNDKVITFKIDSVWKGNIDTDTIKYAIFTETTIQGYESWKKHKTIAFIKQRKKEKLYDYPDSIEYSPYIDFSIFPLDRAFKEYMLQLKHSATISNHNTKRKQ